MGRQRYPHAHELTITADCGGSNGARVRLWKVELQKLADETGLTIRVHRYPPGTSKWNKIEHRLFCHITQNWRGRPLTDRIAVVELIGATTTKTGLKLALPQRSRRQEHGHRTPLRARSCPCQQVQSQRQNTQKVSKLGHVLPGRTDAAQMSVNPESVPCRWGQGNEMG
jgi:hypothetical protein